MSLMRGGGGCVCVCEVTEEGCVCVCVMSLMSVVCVRCH